MMKGWQGLLKYQRVVRVIMQKRGIELLFVIDRGKWNSISCMFHEEVFKRHINLKTANLLLVFINEKIFL